MTGNRVTLLILGILLTVAFFLPFFKIPELGMSASAYDAFNMVMKLGADKVPLEAYYPLAFPLLGVITIIFGGLVFIPVIPLLCSGGLIGYIVYQIMDSGILELAGRPSSGGGGGGDLSALKYLGIGFWLSLACPVLIFLVSLIAAVTKKKKVPAQIVAPQ